VPGKTIIESEFVGRRNELRLFDRLLNGRLKKPFLVFHGIGGVGKSWLVRKLATKCREQSGTMYASIDFSQSQDIDYLLLLATLRNQLNPKEFIKFNAAMEEFALQMRTIYLPTRLKGDIPEINIDIHGSMFSGGVGDIVGIKLENVDVSIPRDELKRIQKERQQQTTQAFLDDLDQMSNSSPIVLLFDTYERIEDPESNLSTELAAWLQRTIFRHIRDNSASLVRVVIARRRALTWQRKDREWVKSIHSVEMKAFGPKETTTYLNKRKIGRYDPSLKQSIYRLTQGHPQCVSLACDLIEDVHRSGEKITSSVFSSYRSKFDERLVSEFLMEAILSRLPQALNHAVRCCALPHYFDAETIRTALNIDTDSQEILDQIARYSFVYPSPSHGYMYHDVVRKLLTAKWKYDDYAGWKSLHRKILRLTDQKLSSDEYEESYQDLLLEKVYHQAYVNEEKALVLFCTLFTDADKALIISYCERLLAIMDEVGAEIDLQAKTNTWISYYRARVHYLKGEWNIAENMLQSMLTNTEDPKLWATVAADLGSLYQHYGRLEDAILWLKKSLDLREESREVSGIVQSLNELGSAYRANIELQEALKCYEGSYEIATRTDPDNFAYDIAYSRLYSGVIYTGFGNYEAALNAYREALSIFQRLNSRYGAAIVNKRLGWMARIRGRFEEAKEYQLQALADLEHLDFPHQLAESLHSMGNIYRQLLEWDEAMNYYQRALIIFQRLGATRHIGIVQNDIGWLYQSRGLTENNHEYLSEALRYFNESLQIKHALKQIRETGPSLCSIGEIYTVTGRWREAEENLLASLQIAREIGVRINESRVLASLCEFNYVRGDVQKMRGFGELALAIAEADNYPHYAEQVYRIYGKLDLDAQELNSAAENYAKALCFALRYNRVRYKQTMNHIRISVNELLSTPAERYDFYQLINTNFSASCNDSKEADVLEELSF
jgi:tetratricopeptide (TPR) repeat protein